MVTEGRLSELKQVYQAMPREKFLSLKQQGGSTLLIFATHFAHIDIMEWLISIGADVNEQSYVRMALLTPCGIVKRDSSHQSVPLQPL